MKIKCDVCKTEYSLPNAPNGSVRCAVCGNVWNCAPQSRRGVLLMFFAAICALIAATVFAVAVIVTSRNDNPNKKPLVASITEVSTENNSDGTSRIVVNGTVTNRSEEVYGLPDLIIVLHDDKGNPISRQRFMPSATLLDAGQSVRFSHTLSGDVSGAKKVTVELQENATGVIR